MLDRVIELEYEEHWEKRETPEKEDDFLNSQFHMDIWTVLSPPFTSFSFMLCNIIYVVYSSYL